MRSFFAIFTISLLLCCVACKQTTPEENFTPIFSTYNDISSSPNQQVTKKETHYGVLTPVEICDIFNRLQVPYNIDILNPVENENNYLSNSQAAVNAGVYGVDFGYLQLFGMGQDVINYMMVVKSVSNKLGIPDNLLLEPIKLAQKDMSDADTITTLMNKAFKDIESHLALSGRESTAGLIVMGGWVEAMYIATQLLYDSTNPDPEVVQLIAEQKYTLTSLLSFLKNYYNDPVVVYYNKKIKYLKNYFDSFDIVFEKGDVEIDKTNQLILSSGAKMDVSVETLNNIRDYVQDLRAELVGGGR